MYNLNEYERQRRIAESTKKLYPPGTRIELLSMSDSYAPVPSGTRGTVKFVDSTGTLFPEWDNGRSLGVVPGEDSFRKLTPRECCRLQGFTDDQFDKAKATGLSDSRLYKMAGNAVTVNVISEIGKITKKVNDKN